MPDPREIFRRQPRLTPGQLRSVADRRYDDAMCLLKSKQNARANGAMYLGGLAVECFLKALLLERHPNLQGRVDPAALSSADREAYALLFSHALDEILAFVPEIGRKLQVLAGKDRKPLWPRFWQLCGYWTIYVRYSPKHANIADAREFLGTVTEVRKWLKAL